jgi:hypothetical protein
MPPGKTTDCGAKALNHQPVYCKCTNKPMYRALWVMLLEAVSHKHATKGNTRFVQLHRMPQRTCHFYSKYTIPWLPETDASNKHTKCTNGSRSQRGHGNQ